MKNFKIGEYLAKLQARAWLSHALCAPGQHTAKRRKSARDNHSSQSARRSGQIIAPSHLRSSSSHQLLVPPFRLTTVGRRTFPVAASLLCNSLPSDIQSSPSLSVFRQRLKTFLFRQSFPDTDSAAPSWTLNYSSAILATLEIFD